jgi:hypothetical protein
MMNREVSVAAGCYSQLLEEEMSLMAKHFAAGTHAKGEGEMTIRTPVCCGDVWHPSETIRSGLGALGDCSFAFEFLENSAPWSVARIVDYALRILARTNVTALEPYQPWLKADSQEAFADRLRRGHAGAKS